MGRDVQQARFFGLADLYRRCQERASSIVVGFRGTEVEQAAAELLTTIEGELVHLSSARDEELIRLRAVLGSHTVASSAALSERLTQALSDLEPEKER